MDNTQKLTPEEEANAIAEAEHEYQEDEWLGLKEVQRNAEEGGEVYG